MLMGFDMMASTKRIRKKALEFIIGPMVVSTKAIGTKASSMGTEFILIPASSLENSGFGNSESE